MAITLQDRAEIIQLTPVDGSTCSLARECFCIEDTTTAQRDGGRVPVTEIGPWRSATSSSLPDAKVNILQDLPMQQSHRDMKSYLRQSNNRAVKPVILPALGQSECLPWPILDTAAIRALGDDSGRAFSSGASVLPPRKSMMVFENRSSLSVLGAREGFDYLHDLNIHHL
ncbi:hypothetical protein BV22DRAFT_1046256 [Leucogyrophana mollusca]|uniref:Uncharacterized protein n=1 Tax=Leucogyrophana mollusca TaxID=85980 RepID=A0ACB8BMP9_9AGAM|nr:hypothetical protein BV22DRAFT_1046256 [Leucogyrophana mollusca]